MICSVILPSRGRPYGLHVALNSLTRTPDQPNEIEVIVGLDEDDTITLPRLSEFNCYPNTTILVNPREPVSVMCYKMVSRAKGDWILFFNDDASLIGSSWDKELARHPKTGVILQPEIHRLGGSTYFRDSGSAFPFFPKSFWDQVVVGERMNLDPVDTGLPTEAKRRGWTIDFVKGLTVFHDRKNP